MYRGYVSEARMPYQFSSRRPLDVTLLFLSLFSTRPNETKIIPIRTFLIKRNTLLLSYSHTKQRYINSRLLAAHCSPPSSRCQWNASSIAILFYQHSCVTPSRVSHLTFCFAERTNTPPCHLDFQRRGSVRHSGPKQLTIRLATWLSSSCQAEDVESTKGSLRAFETPSPSSHLVLAPFVPLRIQARGHAGDAHSALSPDHVAPSSCASSSAEARHVRVPRTRESDDLPVAAGRPPWLHSALAMPWLACSTAAARRVPVFLAGGPHFTGCPVPCSPGPRVGARFHFHFLNDVVFHVKPPCALRSFTQTLLLLSEGSLFYSIFISMNTIPSGYIRSSAQNSAVFSSLSSFLYFQS